MGRDACNVNRKESKSKPGLAVVEEVYGDARVVSEKQYEGLFEAFGQRMPISGDLVDQGRLCLVHRLTTRGCAGQLYATGTRKRAVPLASFSYGRRGVDGYDTYR